MRIYVACPFPRAHDLARPMMKRLRAAGHVISFDWTPEPCELCGWPAPPASPPYSYPAVGMVPIPPCPKDHRGETTLMREEQAVFATQDLEGVRTADLVWALGSDQGGTGMWVELGYALMRRRQEVHRPTIIVSGPPRTIFTSLVKTFPDHEDALAYILSLPR
jgi:hypothetical protein